MTYLVKLSRDPKGAVLVSFPEFPEAHTFGTDDADALAHARDALATVIEAYLKDRRPLPATRAPKRGERAVALADVAAVKVGIYLAMREAKITKSELARRLDWHLPQVDRLLDLRHATRLDQLQLAAAAVGRRVTVTLDTPLATRHAAHA